MVLGRVAANAHDDISVLNIHQWFVIASTTEEAASPATVALCHIRA
jgi:hypothetical protein